MQPRGGGMEINMTKFLLRRFVGDYGDTKNLAVRAAYGKLSGTVGIILNALLFVLKLAAGILASSVSIIADAVNNLSDASSSIISLLGFKLAERPADKEHPYGHGRYEYLSGLMVAVLIMAIGVELFKTGVEKIINPEAVEFGMVTVIALTVSILVKLWLAVFNKKLGRAISSKTLKAAAIDSRNDVITTSAVLAAAIISHFLDIELDGYMGIAVAIFILCSGFTLVRDTLDPMLGKAPDPELVESIQSKILGYNGVLGTHDLMVHDYGPGRQFASVHVEMAAEQDAMESHDIIDKIERDFLTNDGLHMIVHFDPVSETGAEAKIRVWIGDRLREMDSRITIHDLRLNEKDKTIAFDCVMPDDMEMSEEGLRQWICGCMAGKYAEYSCDVIIDRSYAEVAK